METNTNPMQYIPAGQIAIGDAVVESDGYLLAVIRIARKGSLVVLTLANDFSPMREWRSDRGIAFRKRDTTKVAIVRGAGRDVLAPGVLPVAVQS